MSAHTPQILVVDDDPEIRKLLARYIEGQGFRVLLAASCRELRERLATNQIDLVVLDVMLPDGSGLDACRDLRAERSTIPIILLTALKEDVDRIVGLEIGADDYMPKPFEPRELLARLKAILRRAKGQTASASAKADILTFGRLEIDRGAREVRLDGKPAELTSYQFDLIVALAEHPGRVLSREHLMDLVKGEALEAFDRSIDVHVSRIRAAIEDDPKKPRRVITVRGAGYVFARQQD